MFSRFAAPPERYDVRKLVDSCGHSYLFSQELASQQIICDIDKTYLETQFESISQMVRIAFQDAKEKITVKGASDILKWLRWPDPAKPELCRPLHFVSSSPPQLRKVLQEKLAMDGLEWTSDTFKNQAYNIRKGRMDLLRQHIIYKSLAILSVVQKAPDGAQFILIGDNAEHDAYIYLGLKLLVEERLTVAEYIQFLSLAGAEPLQMKELAQMAKNLPKVSIASIFIRQAPGYPPLQWSTLTQDMWQFPNYLDAIVGLLQCGFLDASRVVPTLGKFASHYAYAPKEILAIHEARQPSLAQSPALHDAFKAMIAEIPQSFRNQISRPSPTGQRRWNEELNADGILKAASQWALVLKQKHGATK